MDGKKLNLGCGEDYREGFVNLDYNRNVKSDVCADINSFLPFDNNEFDYVFADNVLEHVNNLFEVMSELHRICKNKAIIEIYVPHYSSPNALKLPYHTYYFGLSSFNFINYLGGMGKSYSNLNFKVLEEKMFLFQRKYYQNKNIDFILKFLNKFSWFFNFSKFWQLFCERFWCFGFDEIYYKLEVIK